MTRFIFTIAVIIVQINAYALVRVPKARGIVFLCKFAGENDNEFVVENACCIAIYKDNDTKNTNHLSLGGKHTANRLDVFLLGDGLRRARRRRIH
jgi:hypothetical protein